MSTRVTISQSGLIGQYWSVNQFNEVVIVSILPAASNTVLSSGTKTLRQLARVARVMSEKQDKFASAELAP
jgi:hypothetical protein